jgi:hypothetical protein
MDQNVVLNVPTIIATVIIVKKCGFFLEAFFDTLRRQGEQLLTVSYPTTNSKVPICGQILLIAILILVIWSPIQVLFSPNIA